MIKLIDLVKKKIVSFNIFLKIPLVFFFILYHLHHVHYIMKLKINCIKISSYTYLGKYFLIRFKTFIKMPGLKPKRKNSMDSDFELPGKQKKKIKKSKTIPKWSNQEYSALI